MPAMAVPRVLVSRTTLAPATPVLAALVVVAVAAFDPWGYAPYGPLRWLLVTMLALLGAAQAVRRRFTVHRASALGWIAFLVWGVMAALFAVDPLHAWIGTPDRRLGWIAWAVLGVTFLTAQAANGAVDRRVLSRAAVIGGLAVGAVVGLERLGLAPAAAGDGSRLVGPLGSAAYLGAALTVVVPVGVAVAVDGDETRWWRVAAALATVAGLAAALGSQTRAAWIGLVVAAAVSAPAWWGGLRRRPRVAASAAAAAAVLLVLVAMTTAVGERLASAVDFDDGGARGRIDEWRIGSAAFASHPVIGVGFEGYRIAFPEEVDAAYARRHGREVAADRAHNGALDVAITTGLPGLALYVAAAVWLSTRAMRGARSGDPVTVGVAAAVAGYVAQQQFLFPVADLDVVFFVLAGGLVAATRRDEPGLVVPSSRWLRAACLAAATVVAVAGVLDLVADRRTAAAIELSEAGDTDGALAAADGARRLRPDSIRYGLVAAVVAGDGGRHLDAIDRIDTALDRSPEDPILAARRATILLDGARAGGDAAMLAAAVASWETLVAADPYNGGHRLQLGVALALTGDVAGAEAAWLAAEDLAPTSPAPARNLAVLYLEMGEHAAAADAVARALAIDPDAPELADLADRIATDRS